MMKHGQRDEPRKPEQHGQGVEPQDGELMGEAREVVGREGEIGDSDE